MPRLYLVRHGETDWNRSGQIMGLRPVPLNRQGEAQARRLAGLLKEQTVDAIVSSPVARAVQTADILAEALTAPMTVDRGLTEIGFGEWEGRFWKDLTDEILRNNFYRAPADTRPPGGETLREVQVRAVAAIERPAPSTSAGTFLIVSHGDVIRAVLAHYLGLDLSLVRQIRIAHASLTVLDVNGPLADLLCVNYPPDISLG